MQETATDRLAIFITDRGFLVPTLVVAQQVAAQARGIADCMIYLVGIEPELHEQLVRDFAPKGLQFTALDTKDFVPQDGVTFRQGHVPVTTLARLVITDYIPEQYKHIAYIDGDIQVQGDIRPLLQYSAPEGMIGAVNGSIWLRSGRNPGWDAEYLKALGGLKPEQYFNAGVLLFGRSAWKEIGPQALRFFFDNSAICYHHDQSALNAVCKDRREVLSPVNNFHSEYARLFLFGKVNPRLVHFTGNTKPWKYPVYPWGQRYADPYIEILSQYPYLQKLMPLPQPVGKPWEVLRNAKMLVKERAGLTTRLANRKLFLDYFTGRDFAA